MPHLCFHIQTRTAEQLHLAHLGYAVLHRDEAARLLQTFEKFPAPASLLNLQPLPLTALHNKAF